MGIEPSIIHVDFAAYRLVQHASELDVVVASNLFGDILADVSALLLGSRSLSFSGNFASTGANAYQTNHGAAHDLVGQDVASPVAQILSTAMMLRESFGLGREASFIEQAVADVWRQGIRTRDIALNGDRVVGTAEMVERIADATSRRAGATASKS
jgi:3-isopropylmalate dehydrogenase